jgi:murein DD-endopeptidase MepM/ murein hydrolase activator NlpD
LLKANVQRRVLAEGVGTKVKASNVISYVGTTGLSAGSHLHIDFHPDGHAVDLLAATLPPASTAVASSCKILEELLTDHIIRVESGGKANAKTLLLNATGARQVL